MLKIFNLKPIPCSSIHKYREVLCNPASSGGIRVEASWCWNREAKVSYWMKMRRIKSHLDGKLTPFYAPSIRYIIIEVVLDTAGTE